jgi:hypothetical protein
LWKSSGTLAYHTEKMTNQATHLPISLTVLQHFKLTHLFPTTLLVTFTSTTTHLRKNINFDLNIDEPSLLTLLQNPIITICGPFLKLPCKPISFLGFFYPSCRMQFVTWNSGLNRIYILLGFIQTYIIFSKWCQPKVIPSYGPIKLCRVFLEFEGDLPCLGYT